MLELKRKVAHLRKIILARSTLRRDRWIVVDSVTVTVLVLVVVSIVVTNR